MRQELEKTKKIEEYLLDKLSEKEQIDFENQLKNNPKLATELEWQKLLMKRIEKIAVKQEISLAHKKYMRQYRFSFKNKVFRNYFIAITSAVLIAITSFIVLNKQNIEEKTANDSFSPILNYKKTFQENTINAKESAIIEYNETTSVIIPSNAFVDELNQPVEGIIVIKFREINVEDSAFTRLPQQARQDKQSIESKAINSLEIYALKDNKPVKIKKGKQIEVIYKAETTSPIFDTYKYDNTNHQWLEFGQDFSLELSGQVKNKQLAKSLLESLHIENPTGDIEIQKEQDAYVAILNQLEKLDSANRKMCQEQGLNNLPNERNSLMEEAVELYRQRLVLIANIKDKKTQSELVSIEPQNEALKKNKEFINNNYSEFEQKQLKLTGKLQFVRVLTINSLGLWQISVQKKILNNEKHNTKPEN